MGRGDDGSLRGEKILLVEDSFLSAMAMQRALEDAGATVLGPHASPDEALESVAECDVAVLDINVRGADTFDVARALMAAGTPFLFITGYSEPPGMPAELARIPRLTKPLAPESLRQALVELLRGARRRSPRT